MNMYGDKYYTVYVEANGDICEMSGYQKGEKLGVDIREEAKYIQAISEMQEPLESYYQKLIEIRKYLIDKYNDKEMVDQLSAFAPQKSAEQIAEEAAAEQFRLMQEKAEEQAKINEALLNSNNALLQSIQNLNEMMTNSQKQIEELKNNGFNEYGNKSDNGLCGNQERQDSEPIREIPAGTQTSTAKRKTNSVTKSK